MPLAALRSGLLILVLATPALAQTPPAAPPANPPVPAKPNAETPPGGIPRGVVPPPSGVDPGMVAAPPVPTQGTMPVIKPPATAR